ncbi:DEAD/DEAH box helicase [Acidipropionibacterium acidipropionici]|uniref:DEAD/DEAH box helicase n=1 Tax=Acidipropionibacterium acidipropionici TaxID=1748 RepID=UPI00110BB250|nr:DEAD/DEAH box helicase [Acidipropionibacterium acidipropionici]QCV96221.1 DEAD/DEAH box helicase [Acidipropionibacterium acidipropionici]
MSELLPPREAGNLQNSLLEYLTTTFALADRDARAALEAFLKDPADGLFKGPYIRTSLPFQAAPRRSADGLAWTPPGFTPYIHQARAFARLNSANRRPLPTLVTTGTGSGKTEAFTYPVLDHAARARRAGQHGVKALFLYPMNALATDQATRLAGLISAPGENPWAGVTAAIYTGERTSSRTRVSSDGLITDRGVIRSDPPDILLTNYKMLDQLLLRPADQRIWSESADTLQYLVLDEFHTYDGAQGTDVAMLLRRLGLALRANSAHPENWTRPLGKITPVGTSATLGGGSDEGRQSMINFATTIFGEPFDETCVVTESRDDIDEWSSGASARVAAMGLQPTPVITSLAREIHSAVENDDAAGVCHAVLTRMYEPIDSDRPPRTLDPDDHDGLLALARAHPLVQALVTATRDATHIDTLADDPALFPGESEKGHDDRVAFLLDLVSALAHLRAKPDRDVVSTETHLWIRELSRIDREATTAVRYHWADDGVPAEDDAGQFFPAIYCRHCGRSGWGVQLAHTGLDLAANDEHIRSGHANHSIRFRALISAVREAGHDDDRLMWFHPQARHLSREAPDPDDEAYRNGLILPVLMLTGDGADEDGQHDVCPSCGQRDGIRFLGSAIATLLSVTMSNLFGSDQIDSREKKALVFADSVQDAAHHAGFISARSHSITLRAVLREGLGSEQLDLKTLTERVLEQAKDDPFRRYRMLPPELANSPENEEFWTSRTWSGIHQGIVKKVERRLLFDAILEFGLSGHYGRTLERTGSAWAKASNALPTALINLARQAIATIDQDRLDSPLAGTPGDVLLRWVRGVLERMRTQGAISHEWFERFIKHDGKRFYLWGGRLSTQRSGGMPAFPAGRTVPGFPYVGGRSTAREPRGAAQMELDPVTGSQSWYADWTRRVLGVEPGVGGVLVKELLRCLAGAEILKSSATEGGRTVYAIPAEQIIVGPVSEEDLENKRVFMRCDTCRALWTGSPETVGQLAGGPCLSARCIGHLEAEAGDPGNAYRHLYGSSDMRRVISSEHTSLLSAATRAEYESAFKRGSQDPAAPNVLVATPTLEMGIDIGDLSAVFLAGLPRHVSNYVQRVGRAGRLSGNALDMAYVRGRGEFLPRLGEPESLINGDVQPPATYLSAEEILKRQYLAHIGDGLARDDVDAHHPSTIAAAMNTDPGGYLDGLIRAAEEPGRLDAFLATFDGIDDDAAATLKAWVRAAEPTQSDLARTVYGAARSWRTGQEALRRRKDDILAVLEKLRRRSEITGDREDVNQYQAAEAERALVDSQLDRAEDDQIEEEHRTASSALRLVNREIAQTGTQYWISALEEYGLFPNYTLLDDSVTLDVAMSWLNPDTQEYEHEPTSYQRGAGTALREFAPGATFYAHGYAVKVDSVDLGPDAQEIRTWVFCPQCGYGKDVSQGGRVETVTVCPRCGCQEIGDSGNRMEVVEFTKASANVNRDSSRITDSADERTRASFTTMLAADVDRSRIARQWFVEGSEFGAKQVNGLTLRWLNLGKRVEQGTQRTIAGEDHFAPLFTVCEGCGHIDTQSRANKSSEHAPWCRYRDEPEEHNRSVALSRTMTTQGVLMPLPWSITTGDQFAVPSLAAAVLMGLKTQFGGSPDHIGVSVVSDPTTPGEAKLPALLLHDLVPGGTGYLAKLASAKDVWAMLYSAWRRLRDCECQHEGRQACHRCLLPYASPWQVPNVSRQSAERHLRELLTAGSGEEPGEEMGWTVSDVPASVDRDDESFLEQRFRREVTQALGDVGTVREVPGPTGNKLSVSVGERLYTINPQVDRDGSRPDFEVAGGGLGIEIFTDGLRYHASTAINRLADDAVKRAALRQGGRQVLGVTMADCQAEAARREAGEAVGLPSWIDTRFTGPLRGAFGFSQDAYDALTGGPFAFLNHVVSGVSRDDLRRFSDAVPGYFALAGRRIFVEESAGLSTTAAQLVRGYPVVGQDSSPVTWWRQGPLGVLTRMRAADRFDVCVVLDDRDPGAEGFAEAWREWLRISNALIARSGECETSIVTVKSVAEEMLASRTRGSSVRVERTDIVDRGVRGVDVAVELAPEWAAVLEDVDDRLEGLVRGLADAGVPVPETGEEIAGVPTEMSWPSARVVVLLDEEPGDAEELGSERWTVALADVDAVVAAVKGDHA